MHVVVAHIDFVVEFAKLRNRMINRALLNYEATSSFKVRCIFIWPSWAIYMILGGGRTHASHHCGWLANTHTSHCCSTASRSSFRCRSQRHADATSATHLPPQAASTFPSGVYILADGCIKLAGKARTPLAAHISHIFALIVSQRPSFA